VSAATHAVIAALTLTRSATIRLSIVNFGTTIFLLQHGQISIVSPPRIEFDSILINTTLADTA
jgi:hypothetical protein